MSGIGIYLKQAREEVGYSLEDMSRFTNIHTDYLHALENDQFDKLPSPFYARAFLRTYAKSFGLETQPLLDMYERMVKEEEEKAKEAPPLRRAPSLLDDLNHTKKHRTTGSLLEEGDVTEPIEPVPPPKVKRPTQPTQPTARATSDRTQPIAKQTRPPSATMPPRTSTTMPRNTAPANPRVSGTTPAVASKWGESQPRKKKSMLLPVAVAIGALVLVGVGYVAWGNGGGVLSTLPPQKVVVQPKKTPTLTYIKTSDNPLEGALYSIQNVPDLEVTIRATKGVTTLRYAPELSQAGDSSITLQQGQQQVLDVQGKTEVWFLLGRPSNAEVTVNGQTLDTSIQDTWKSYRVAINAH